MAFGLDSPEKQRSALFVLLLAGLGYVFWQYLYSPLRAERLGTEEQLATLQSYNDQARALTQPTRLRELEQREAEYQVRLAEYETLLPSEAEVPTLLEEVAFAAIENDVKIVNFAPLPEVPGDVLVEIPYDVQVQGDYHEVGRFLASVVSFPRVVRPTISELLQSEVGAVQGMTTAPQPAQPGEPGQAGGYEETGYEVLATMRLSTYVPLVVRSDVSSVLEAEPVASSVAPAEVMDES
ncbi:MAG TPA: type 4a pilus biogenesis protein PilO [Gemmatimonadota bacterium]|nr:type 4a pilus biogenesis protein PilO [Gemmatimonadota bacterium]